MRFICAIGIFTLLLHGSILQTYYSYSMSISQPMGAGEDLLQIQEEIFNTENLLDLIQSVIHNSGGMPGRESQIENGFFATRLLDLIENSPITDYSSFIAYIVAHQNSDGGFSFTEDNSTLIESYWAMDALNTVGASYSGLDLNMLGEFVNGSIINEIAFGERPSNEIYSIRDSYAGLEIAALLGWELEDLGLNLSLFHNFLLEQFDQEKYFFDSSISDFEATHLALKCLNYSGFLESNRTSSQDIVILNSTGNILSGSNASVANDEGDFLLVDSEQDQVNLTIFFPLDQRLLANSDSFQFSVKLNASSLVDINASLSIYNFTAQEWANVSENLAFNSDVEGGTNFYESAGEILTAHFLEDTGSASMENISARIFFNHTSSFSLSLDWVSMNYTVFNKSFVAENINATFSSAGGYFDPISLERNYYALEILEFLNYSTNLLNQHKNNITDFVNQFRTSTNLFTSEENTANPHYLDSDLATIFYATGILNHTGNLDTTTKNTIGDFINSWVMFDSGFGSPADLSLEYTFYYIEFLISTGEITAEMRSKTLDFVYKWQSESSGMGYAFSDKFESSSTSSDTYFALKILDLLGELVNCPHLQQIGEYFVENQDAEGYFFSSRDIMELFFALEVIRLSGTTLAIQEDAMIDYLVSLQGVSGGFYATHFHTYPDVASTSYAILTGKSMNFLDSFTALYDAHLGYLDFLEAHQNATTGGFFEQGTDIFEISAGTADIRTSFLVTNTLANIQDFSAIDSKSLLSFILAQKTYFNNFAALSDPASEKYSFTTGIMNRFLIYRSFNLLDAWRLRISININPQTAVKNQNAEITINVSNPHGIPYEGIQISILQPSLGVGVSLKDHNNGTYTGQLAIYETPGTYQITVSCDHPDYIGFAQNYTIKIREIFDSTKMGLEAKPTFWFKNSESFKITLVNHTSGLPVSGCNVTLCNVTSGEVFYNLTDPENDGSYRTTLQVPVSFIGTKDYSLVIEGTGFRTEILPVSITVYPLWLLFVFIGMAAGLALVGVFAVKKRHEIAITLRKVVAKARGKKIGLDGLKNEIVHPKKTPETPGDRKNKPKGGELDIA